MKNQTIITAIAAITLMAILPIPTLSQNNAATSSFSVFSQPQNIGTAVNSPDNESAAVVSPNGLSLYFSSNRSGTMGNIDLWVSQRATLTSAWGQPQNLEMINSPSNENLPSLSFDGKTMFFSCSCSDTSGGTDLYMTTRTDPNNDLGWTAPVNLGAVINTGNGEIAPAYFENSTNGEGILYFTSDRNGDEDIFQSTRNANGTFNTPASVSSLNSSSTDRGVTIRRDGLEIFFASDRDGGQGARDIWVASRASVSASWNSPVNLATLNSAGNDQSPSLSQDSATLYFASSREGGSGNNDIYAATRVSVNRTPTADFDGDGRSDIGVFRPSEGKWYVLESNTNTLRTQDFGMNGDKIVPGDYDGDGKTDFSVFRSADRDWYILLSADNQILRKNLGKPDGRLIFPVPGDYDGDGRTDISFFRSGIWQIINSSNGNTVTQQLGMSTDIPITLGPN